MADLKNIPTWIKENLYITVIIALIWACYGGFIVVSELHEPILTVNQTANDTDKLIISATKFMDSANDTMVKINKPQSGTIALLNTDLNTLKSEQIHIDMILRDEESLNAQQAQLFQDIHNTTAGVNNLTSAGTKALNGVSEDTAALKVALNTTNEQLKTIAPLVNNLNNTVTTINTTVSNPAITQTLEHVNGVTNDAQKVSDHFEQIIDHPKKVGFWGHLKQGWQIAWQIGMLAR